MNKYVYVAALVLLMISITACNGSAPAAEGTATPDVAMTAQQSTADAEAQEALDAQATADAQAALDAEATSSAEATAQAGEMLTATANAEATAVKATQNAEREAARATSTAEAKAAATAAAAPMASLLETLLEDGAIDDTTGTYHQLPDYDASWAQLNWYDYVFTGYAPDDFVVRADLSWDSASDKANWWTSGCGFVFHISEKGEHYLVYLGLDGYVNFMRNTGYDVTPISRSYAGDMEIPAGGAELMVSMDGSLITFYVNGEKIRSVNDQGYPDGGLGYTLVSGTNKDFGTYCEWSNVELWELH